MNTNVLSDAATPDGVSGEPRGLMAALAAAFLLAARNYLKRRAGGKAELVSRAELCAEMREISDRIHADHLALLEKLDTNHRELLAALERQGYSMRSSSWPVSWPASGPVSWTIRTV
jgi:hypothetical protein